MLDGRVLEASQVEYKPFGKPPLQRERYLYWVDAAAELGATARGRLHGHPLAARVSSNFPSPSLETAPVEAPQRHRLRHRGGASAHKRAAARPAHAGEAVRL